ncbi:MULTISPECIES: response regulator [unclassified Paludibacterium]|uniref:response regulator n=1 Tax=unclassified Paludibacterium TaxID=2618429 RepID=UPI00207B1509|nr:response regulator [Paludibacterium sp. B53371]
MDLPHARILVVDDQLLVRTLVGQVLRSFGVVPDNILQATDGNHALHVLAVRKADLVLCDMQMSPVNGMDLLKMLRCAATPQSPDLPFVFLSAHPDRSNILLAAKLHADGFIIKPPKPNDIEKNLQAALSRPRPAIDPFSYFAIATGSEYDSLTFERPMVPKQSQDLTQLLERYLRPCALAEARPGDMLARPLLDQAGRELLDRGVRLSAQHLDVLQRFQSVYGIASLAIADLPQEQMAQVQALFGTAL